MNSVNNDQEQSNNLIGYIIFLSGQWVSILGSTIVNFGIIWFLTETTGSEAVLGIAAFLAFAPVIIVTPFAGVFVDRWSRKKVVMFVDFMQAFFTLLLIIAFISAYFQNMDLVIVILVVNFIRGIFGAFHTSATDTLLPIMVPKSQLSRINGINYFVNAGINIAGPVLGAFALGLVGGNLGILLWLDVITFLIAVIPTLVITIPKIPRKEKVEEKIPFRQEFREGIGFITKTKGLFPLMMVFAGANFFLVPLFTQLPILIKVVHSGTVDDFALVLSLQQAGILIGSLIMSSWKGFDNHAKGVAIGLFLGYIGMFVTVLAPINEHFISFLILGLGLFISGLTLPVANVSSEAIWGVTVPREILGRVYAVRRTIAQATAPVAMLLSGFLAEAFGLVFILFLAAGFGVFLLAFTWFFTPLPRVEETLRLEKEEKMEVIT